MEANQVMFVPKDDRDFSNKIIIINENSRPIAYTQLIPVGEFKNLTQLAGFNTPTRILLIGSESGDVNTGNILGHANFQKNANESNCMVENLKEDEAEDDDADCMIIENENQNDTDGINKSSQKIDNSFNQLPLVDESNVDIYSSKSDEDSEDTLSANEDDMQDIELDVKPFISPDFNYSDTLTNTDIEIKTELNIKDEYLDDEPSCSYYNLNTEVIIKSEELDCELSADEAGEKGDIKNAESTESFLINSPAVFSKFCGLPSMSVFNALLHYIEDDLPPLPGVTKFEQLFSVLAKLHKNEDNLYLNKYIFPPAYVNTVELLYRKLKLWCKKSPDFSIVPEILMPEFDSKQKIVIIGIITVYIRSDCKNFLKKLKSVKYLIAYTAFGEVFFVSNAFVGTIPTLKLMNYCGILSKLDKKQWILFHRGNVLYTEQVKIFLSRKATYNKALCRITSDKVQSHILQVINRLCEHFKVLKDFVPDFMLKSERGVCFLDRLVFVCCMLLNMLPRITYK